MRALTCTAALLALATTCPAAPATRLYVSPSGRDSWSGRLAAPNARRTDGPLATPEGARDAVRRLKASHGGRLAAPIRVLFRSGTYYLKQPLQFGPDDSGTAAAPIVYAAFPGEHPLISGGRPIGPWKRTANGMLTASLPDVKAGTWSFRRLRVGEEMAIRARYPDYDPKHPHTGGWLFAQWWGEPWERGTFDQGVGGVQDVGARLEWRVKVPAAGRYSVWVRYSHAMGAPMDGHTTLRAGGGAAVPMTALPDTGGWGSYRWAKTAALDLVAGEQTLVWENVKGGGLNLDAFSLTDDPAWAPAKARSLGTPRPETGLAPGSHLLLVQAEACSAHAGPHVSISAPGESGAENILHVPEADAARMAGWAGGEIRLFPAWGWVNVALPVGSVNPDRRLLEVKCAQEIRTGNRFFIEGVRSALDAPGEWFLDQPRGELLYIPRGAGDERLTAVAPAMDRLITLAGAADAWVEHLRFEGLTFSDTDYTLGGYYDPADSAIWMARARHCEVRGCRFTNLGGYAVRMERQANANSVVGCSISNLGGGGVILLGSTADQPADNLIAANDMHDLGCIYAHVAGVYVTTGSRNRILNNRMRRLPRYGVSLKSYSADAGSHGNVVAFNEIVDSNLETNDTGAIETLGRDMQLTGNVLFGNVIRNVVGLKTDAEGRMLTPYFTWGIYLDDFSSGTIIRNNVVDGTVIGGICIHAGKANIVENNIFLNGSEMNLRLQPHDDFCHENVFRRNIVAYRNPKALLWYSYESTWTPTIFTACDSNLYWNTGGLNLATTSNRITPEGSLAAWRAKGLDTHALVADPRLVAPEKGDYRLRPDSPAYRLGFQRIDLTRVGPSGYRPKAPLAGVPLR